MQVAIRYAVTEGKMENVLHIDCGSTPQFTDLSAVAIEIMNWWTNTYRAFISDQVSLTSIYGRDVSQSGVPGWEIGQVATPGQAGGDVLPWKDSFALKKISDVAGRRRNGRLYVFGLVKGVTLRNSVTSLWAQGVRLAWDTLTDNLSAIGYPAGWVSYCYQGVWRPQGLFCPITEWVITDLLIDNQGRRKPNVGS